LESFQSVDIKNDIGFSIWRYKLKVMMKIKVGEQVLECLNQNYKGWNLFKSNVFYIIEFFFKEHISKMDLHSQFEGQAKSYDEKKR
jgi:hypothetical protein